jgi:iron complex outermembrane receptor protein
LFDRALQINLAAYLADTTGLQVRSMVNGTIIDTNAGAERVKGIEAEITARFSSAFKMGVNYAYTDAKYRNFQGCTAAGFDCTGQYVPFIPKHDLLVSADYTADLGLGELLLHGDVKFASKMWQAAVNSSQPLGRALSGNDGLASASITYRPHGEPWEVQLWGKNLFNEWFIAQSYNLNFYALSGAEIASGLTEVIRGAVNPPRQIGATFRLQF